MPNGAIIDKITTYDEYLASDEMARKRTIYTKTEDDANVDAIESVFDGAAAWIAAQLNSVQYEDDTGLVHYEWAWEALV